MSNKERGPPPAKAGMMRVRQAGVAWARAAPPELVPCRGRDFMTETSSRSRPTPLTGTVTIVCLSRYLEDRVQELLGDAPGVTELRVRTAPPPPASDAVRELLKEADIVIGVGGGHRLDRETLSHAGRCRLIQQPSVGFDVIDHRAAAEFGIPVANAAGYNRDSVADLVIMGILNLLRLGAVGDREFRRGGWGPHPEGRELGALTVGIVGLGNVGNAVATRLRAFGSRTLFTDIIPRSLPGAESVSLEELLRRSDVVTVHVPLDHETCQLIGGPQLDLMSQGAILVNASRGPVVDEQALIGHLQSGHLGGAVLDVFEQEPLQADSPLREMENVFLRTYRW
ncbi:MAG: NAD(P)-dependent oxidoreductase [Candidatus Dormibacteraceae bacterium]